MPKRTPEEIAQMILDNTFGNESEIDGLSDEEDGIPEVMAVLEAPSEEIELEPQDEEPEPPSKKLKKNWKKFLGKK